MQHYSLKWTRLLLAIVLASFGMITSAHAQAVLESPAPGAFVQSGVGLIRGWVCDAAAVEFSIDGGAPQAIAYGSDRPDTVATCGDTNNGFGFTQNWSEIGDGVHNLRAFADGVAFADVNFTVTTLGRTFLTGLRAQYTLRDFPAAGNAPQVRWAEPQQNFVFARQATIPANTPPPSNPRVVLESPTQGSYQSGVELIRGWACEGQRVEFSIDGGPRQAVAYGTDRPDTQSVCGDRNNGFGFTQNWNRVGEGAHNLRAYLDNVEFANVNFAVTTLGGEYLTGLSGQFTFNDFPETGQATTAEWSEPQQNFIVARSSATPSRLALIAAITDALNPMAVAGNGAGAAAGDSTGVRTAKRADGQPTQLEGITWANSQTGQAADLQLAPDGLPTTYTDSSGVEARFSDYNLNEAAASVTVSFFRNGAAQGVPATVPVEGGGLRALQTHGRAGAPGHTKRPGRIRPATGAPRRRPRPAGPRSHPVALYPQRPAGQQLLVWQRRRRRHPVRGARRRRSGRRERPGRPRGLPVPADRRLSGPGRRPARRGGRTARVRHRSAGAAGPAGRRRRPRCPLRPGQYPRRPAWNRPPPNSRSARARTNRSRCCPGRNRRSRGQPPPSPRYQRACWPATALIRIGFESCGGRWLTPLPTKCIVPIRRTAGGLESARLREPSLTTSPPHQAPPTPIG